ncbi:MAG TPA: glycosyltransferase family 4 protein [Thermoanaerobaculia bacterium]|nr:glycosyltransferase family 4 protein [Thermoanaerobaculia bacterium]
MKILLVSHPPLAAELGAAQVALNLAAALRDRGHDARAWSPEPLPPGTRWWNLWLRQRRIIERFAAAAGPFDVVDTPALSASRELARHGALIVRSIQPELRYLWHNVRTDLGRHPSPRAAAHAVSGAHRAAAIASGWHRARAILCMGSHELAWMRRRFPCWSAKLGCYLYAPPPDERSSFAQVRRARQAAPGPGRRFLWIGRWTAHKGTERLLRWLRERLAGAPEDVVTLAGCGPVERDLVPAWLRSGQVRVVPSFTRAELPALLAAHTVGLFTSEVEGWGISLNEMLESGMIVLATDAGAVGDLRPFFPVSLRPFPPPPTIASGPLEDLDANGYHRRFSWPEIALAYERQVTAAIPAGRA